VPGLGFTLSKLVNTLFPDPSLRLSLEMAEKLEMAREESKPIILFVDHSGQLSMILPFRVYGNFLFFEFNGEKYVTYYDAQRTYRLKGQPVVHCLENQLYPVYLFDAAVLSYINPLRELLYNAMTELREKTVKEHPEYLEELKQRKTGAQGQGDPPDPVMSDNPLLQIEAVRALLASDKVKEVLRGVELALAALGVELAPPIDLRVITRYVPRKTTLKELLTYFERWAYAQFAAFAGLHQFYAKKLDMNKLLRSLILLGLILFGVYFVATYLLPMLTHAAQPRPPG
jgi:TM2 domain-containing membrane protein YozV